MTKRDMILHAKINTKGTDTSVPMSNLHDRIVRKDRKSAYSLRGLFVLDKILKRKYNS